MAETPELEVDLGSAVPPAEQIRARIAALVRTGALAPGTRLPAVRTLAADLGIAPGTVARAYKELETDGLVRGAVRLPRGGRAHGSRVPGPDRRVGARPYSARGGHRPPVRGRSIDFPG